MDVSLKKKKKNRGFIQLRYKKNDLSFTKKNNILCKKK